MGFEEAIFSLLCVGPFALLAAFAALIVWLTQRGTDRKRIARLEQEVLALRTAVSGIVQPTMALRVAEIARAPEPVAQPATPPAASETEAAPETEAAAETEAAPETEAAAEAGPEPVTQPPHPPPAAPPPPPPPRDDRPASSNGGWERLVGVRAAAALGALVLVLAGLYFFRYSIEHGLISPAVRVALGTVVGIGCIAASETWLRLRYRALAPWLAGAGIAILYLAFWSAAALYDLVPTVVAGALMVLVTATCCVLAIKRSSSPIAVLGLLGGFATPLLLSTGQDRPIALFSYVLVLDAALLFVAHRREWSWLALLALVGTTLYQGLWIVGRMGAEPDRVLLGMAIVVVFGALFAIAGSMKPRAGEEAAPPRSGVTALIRIAATLTPFLFALYFAMRADLGPHLWPTAGLLVVLVLGAGLVARRDRTPWIAVSAACAALGVLAGFLLVHPVEPIVAWEVLGFAGAMAVALHVIRELDRGRTRESALAASLWSLGALLLTTLAVVRADAIVALPWLVLYGLLAALGLRQASLAAASSDTGRFEIRAAAHALFVAVPSLFGLALAAIAGAHTGATGMPPPDVMLAITVALALAYALATVRVRTAGFASWAAAGAAILALILTLYVATLAPTLPVSATELVLAVIVLAFLAALVTARFEPGPWMIAAAALAALAFAAIGLSLPPVAHIEQLFVLGAHGVLAALLAVVPFVSPQRVRDRRWVFCGAAIALPLFFPFAAYTWHAEIGPDGIAAVPLGLAAIALAVGFALSRKGPSDTAARKSAIAWVAGSAIALVTIAIPLELENEWLTVTWALQAAALLLLFRRVDHAGLKWIALALACAVTVRLVGNPWVLEYAPRGPIPILNWLSYTYLVPFFALLAAYALLRPVEVARLRPPEREVLGEHPRGAQAIALAAIAILFAFVNLAIFDVYATGPSLEIPLDRLPARDLTLSIGWAVFALGLLALGMWRKSTALRVISLALMLITTSKVFLYDLSQLEDLYRVASLVGLAVSLLLISLAYQRFVFRRLTAEAS